MEKKAVSISSFENAPADGEENSDVEADDTTLPRSVGVTNADSGEACDMTMRMADFISIMVKEGIVVWRLLKEREKVHHVQFNNAAPRLLTFYSWI